MHVTLRLLTFFFIFMFGGYKSEKVSIFKKLSIVYVKLHLSYILPLFFLDPEATN